MLICLRMKYDYCIRLDHRYEINDQIAESRLLVFHKKQFISLLCRQWLLHDDHKFTSAIKNIGLVEITQAGHY